MPFSFLITTGRSYKKLSVEEQRKFKSWQVCRPFQKNRMLFRERQPSAEACERQRHQASGILYGLSNL